MFKSITIENLRAITKLKVDNLGQVNLFVGQNSCGKTTFLEGVFFLIGATNPQLPVNANLFRDFLFPSNRLWSTYFHNMDLTIPVEIHGQIREHSEQQDLTIRPYQTEDARSQVLESKPASQGFPSAELSPSEPETAGEPNGLELEYSSSKDPGEKTISRIFLRGNQLLTDGTRERDIRGVFVSPFSIHNWKNRFSAVQDRKQVPEVIGLLKELEPRLSDLRLGLGLLLADIGLPELMPANLMGGGFAKLLSIALAMLDSRNGIVLIDEVENGLHHSVQRIVWEAIFNWAEKLNVQVLATTHSGESIRAFKDSADSILFENRARLFRIERKGDKSRAVEYTKELLSESIESKWEVR